jgi:UDP-2,3-diacylglucosamine pyrophosphatase LpxH
MLVAISDLHFEEEARDCIKDTNGVVVMEFRRNFSPEAFRKFKDQLSRDAAVAKAGQVDVVLAGDIFDLHRTALWFDDSIRPWDAPKSFAPNSPGEAKVLKILNAIAQEESIQGSLQAISELSQAMPNARLHYLPGNHDRLANATENIRNRVRELLGMPPTADPFPHFHLSKDPPVLVRHGHEYDGYNFSADYSAGPLPLQIPEETYGAPAFGDFITVEIASQLPVLFRKHYGDEQIVKSHDLGQIYLRLLEFDDVRPQSALIDFILATPGTSLDQDQLWSYVEPVARELLEKIHDHPFLRDWLDRLKKHCLPDVMDLVELLLSLKAWRLGLPLGIVRKIASGLKTTGGSVSGNLLSTVQKEEVLADRVVRAVIAGHTHEPQVALLGCPDNTEQYYIDTGTWRNYVPSTPDERGFGRLKALTYLVAYGKDEDTGKELPPQAKEKVWSFDYWSGFTQRWWA